MHPPVPASHPFYLVPTGSTWRVFRYAGSREISHADYWRQTVALIVDQIGWLDHGDPRSLRKLLSGPRA